MDSAELLSRDLVRLTLNPLNSPRPRSAADPQRRQAARQAQTQKRPGKRRRGRSDEFSDHPKEDTEVQKAAVKFTFGLPEWSVRWSQLVSQTRCKRIDKQKDGPNGFKSEPTAAKPGPVIKRYAFVPFRFLDLPRELRNIVYGFALRQDSDARLFLSVHKSNSPKISRLSRTSHALLISSRQTQDEGLPILYRSNGFYARCIKMLPAIVSSVGENQNQIRRLELSFLGKTSKDKTFEVLNSLCNLYQLERLDIAFDHGTLDYFQRAFEMKTLKRLCPHQILHGKAFQTYQTLMGCLIEWEKTRRMRFIFDSSESDSEEECSGPTTTSISSGHCIPCGVVRGLEKLREANEKRGAKTWDNHVQGPHLVVRLPRIRAPGTVRKHTHGAARPVLSSER